MGTSEWVECALLLGFHFSFPGSAIPLIPELAVQTWHASHENRIGLLQYWRNPESVPVPRQAIRLKPGLEYLDYDDYGSCYKKCLWALHDIGTPPATAVIRACAASEDAVLRKKARERLAKSRDTGA